MAGFESDSVEFRRALPAMQFSNGRKAALLDATVFIMVRKNPILYQGKTSVVPQLDQYFWALAPVSSG